MSNLSFLIGLILNPHAFQKKYFKKDDVVVVLLHDSGSRYVGKIYNDDWMKANGFKLD